MNCATTSVEQCALLIGVRREDHITVDLTMLVKTLTSEGVILPSLYPDDHVVATEDVEHDSLPEYPL